MMRLVQFCQRHYYAAFVFFGVGAGIEAVSPHFSPVLGRCVSIVGLVLLVISGVAVAIGLIREGRKLPPDDKGEPPK